MTTLLSMKFSSRHRNLIWQADFMYCDVLKIVTRTFISCFVSTGEVLRADTASDKGEFDGQVPRGIPLHSRFRPGSGEP